MTSTPNVVSRNGVVTTHSGVSIDLRNPSVDDVSIVDVAHTLSHICRWNGIPEDFFSVAEHCVMVAERVPPRDQLGALMHDCEESILGDNITPLKDVIPELRVIGDRVRELFLKKYEIPYDAELIARADKEQLEWERANIINDDKYVGLSPKKARALFVKKFEEYSNYFNNE